MRVRILKPSVSVTQSACGCREQAWLIEPELETPRAPEPLMGWIAADDSLSSLRGRLRFSSREEAESFARKQGWTVMIEEPNERRVVPRSYLDNFNPDRRRDGVR